MLDFGNCNRAATCSTVMMTGGVVETGTALLVSAVPVVRRLLFTFGLSYC